MDLSIFFDSTGSFIWISVTSIVSFIAAVISIWSIFANRKTQNNIAKQQIDANLKAKARIDWIEKVRGNSSYLLVNLSFLQKENINFNEKWENVEKYSELIKLYFSSKKNIKVEEDIFIKENIIKISSIAEEILFNELSNKNKNQYVIQYINCIKNLYKNDHMTRKRSRLVSLYKANSKMLEEQMQISYSKQVGVEHVEVENEGIYDIPIMETNYNSGNKERWVFLQKQMDGNDEKIKKIKDELEGFTNVINEFFMIISLYLKIEWDIAKEGK